MKTCTVCFQEKNLDQYYKGYATCKSCHYNKVKIYRQSEAGKLTRKKERRKAKESGAYQTWQTKYESSEKGKTRQKEYAQKRMSTEFGKTRQSAKNAVKYALKTGKLKREVCFVCGENQAHAHHSSYAKDMRLVVTWLCHVHHNEIHNPVGGHLNGF